MMTHNYIKPPPLLQRQQLPLGESPNDVIDSLVDDVIVHSVPPVRLVLCRLPSPLGGRGAARLTDLLLALCGGALFAFGSVLGGRRTPGPTALHRVLERHNRVV